MSDLRDYFKSNGSCEDCMWENEIDMCEPFGLEGYCEHYTPKEEG